MGEWKPIRLAALGDIVTGKTPSKDNPEDWGDVMPFVTPSDYSSYGKYAGNSERKLSKSGIERLRKKVVPPGSILVTCIGSDMGKSVINRVPVITNQQINSISIANEEIDPDFIYYSMVGMEDELKNLGSSGSAVPLLNKGDFEQIEVNCPDLPAQRAIASVLSSLDAKIDLLHRQNKTLEGMAEALFRQWFVEEAEEGWEEVVLTDIATHCKDSVNPGQHPTRLYHHYSLPAYDEGRKPSPELGDSIKSSKYVVPENAVLISKLNPRFPRVWPVRDKRHEHPISSTEFQVFVPKKDEMFGFLYCFLISKPVQDELASAASGTSGSHQRVSPDDIKGLSFQAKSKQQIVDFSKVVDPLLKKIETNKDQVANLTKLRDTLLPKLMSGEVRVEERYSFKGMASRMKAKYTQ